ncbi:MAG: trigger factor [Planctomycetes bacterium]|nr:trigger factor [Planctomycetota bacterium]MCB9934308.1 trigger factor [Planctomycetota bacterium]
MLITVENAGGCKRIIKAEIPAEVVTSKLNEGFRDINKQVQFPGFRKGKAPRNVLEKRFGKEVADDVRQTLADDAVKFAIDEHALKLLGQVEVVEVGDIKLGNPVTMKLEAEVYPEFELPEYKGLELERPAVKVEEHEVHAQLRGAQMNKGELKSVEGASEKGQFIRANVKVTVGGEEVFSQNRGLLEVGFGWVAGLKPAKAEQQLVGLKAGDSKEMKATLPDDFGREDLRGKEAVIHLEVADVLAYEGPGLEDLARQAGFESVEAWREDLNGKVMSAKEAELDRAMEEKALKQVAEKTEMDLPEKFSQRKAAELVQQQAYRMYQQGAPEENIREFLQSNRDQGVDEVKVMLKRAFVTDAIARKERLVVTEDEIQREVARMAQMVGRTPDEVYAQFQQNGTLSGMREELKTSKVLKLLRQKAKYV